MRTRLCLAFFVVIAAFAITVNGQTNTFTYQGRLTDGITAANGTYNMQFRLFGSLSGADLIGSIPSTPVTVTNGIFTIPLDFGAGAFPAGSLRWLEIQVESTTLTPRQQITSAPYAIQSSSAATADNTLKLQGVNVAASVPSGNQVLKFNAGANQWEPSADNDTTYTAGTGLQLGGTEFSANFSSVQARVTGTCAAGTVMTGIDASGAVTCVIVSVPFSGITTGTNAVALHVGTGGSLDTTGSGTIAATSAPASGLTGPTLSGGVTSSSLTSVGNLVSLIVNGNTTLGDASTDTVTINAGPVILPNATAAADALVLGGDANLYRSAPDTLKTDDSLVVNGNITAGNSTTDRLTVTGELRLGLSSSDPPGTAGLMLYNTTTQKFRCFEAGAWKDCIGSVARPAETPQQEMEKLRQQVERQQAEIDGLKKLLCPQNPDAEVCKQEDRK